MENIKFEITKQDIKEYLKQHKDDESIKFKEAMFVKYMREQESLTKESLEILMCMYNGEDIKPSGIYMECPRSTDKMFYELPDFNKYLKQIENLDISGICHILIPTITYYNENKPSIPIGVINNYLRELAYKFNICVDDNLGAIVRNTIINYRICDELGVAEDLDFIPFIIPFKMDKEQSEKRLQEYVNIYGKEKVKVITKTISERM